MSDERPFRVGFVPGVTLTKWSRIWSERHPRRPIEITVVEAEDPTACLAETADVVFARLPLPADGFHAIRLYDEQPVVVVPKGGVLAEFESLEMADLDGETRFDLDASLDAAMQVEVVATGAGVAVMPQSLARLNSRKDVVARPVTDAEATTIALVWPVDRDSDDIDDFIGIVRGRTANSSRGATEASAAAPAAPSGKTTPSRAPAKGSTPRRAPRRPATAKHRRKR